LLLDIDMWICWLRDVFAVYIDGTMKDMDSESVRTGEVIAIFSGVMTGAVIEILLLPLLAPVKK